MGSAENILRVLVVDANREDRDISRGAVEIFIKGRGTIYGYSHYGIIERGTPYEAVEYLRSINKSEMPDLVVLGVRANKSGHLATRLKRFFIQARERGYAGPVICQGWGEKVKNECLSEGAVAFVDETCFLELSKVIEEVMENSINRQLT